MLFPVSGLSLLGELVVALALGYSGIALAASVAGLRRSSRTSNTSRPVTILKPLCGDEPELYENLRSFCVQAYSPYQIVFGVNRGCDPALAVAQRVQADFPALDIEITRDCPPLGCNRKVENLAHMMGAARHDIIVIADSDIRVEPDYLTRVVSPLADERVGLVTCLYRARPGSGLWSRLGAQYIDDWFTPSVLIAQWFGGRTFAFGATIALQRDTLDAIGGFAAIADHLADDHMLGARVRARGLGTVLSDCVVETTAHESGAGQLICHERRWMQTIRAVQPLTYHFTFISCALPLALLGAILAHGAGPALDGAVAVLGLRLTLRLMRPSRRLFDTLLGLALVPLREFFTAYAWLGGLISRNIVWRDQHYALARDGSIQRTTWWDKS